MKVERGWLGLDREPPKERGELGEGRWAPVAGPYWPLPLYLLDSEGRCCEPLGLGRLTVVRVLLSRRPCTLP